MKTGTRRRRHRRRFRHGNIRRASVIENAAERLRKRPDRNRIPLRALRTRQARVPDGPGTNSALRLDGRRSEKKERARTPPVRSAFSFDSDTRNMRRFKEAVREGAPIFEKKNPFPRIAERPEAGTRKARPPKRYSKRASGVKKIRNPPKIRHRTLPTESVPIARAKASLPRNRWRHRFRGDFQKNPPRRIKVFPWLWRFFRRNPIKGP